MAFIKLFMAGTHRTAHPKKTWTNDDVDAVFSATLMHGPKFIPFVVGHPKDDLPVVGRLAREALKLIEEGDKKVIGFDHEDAQFSLDDLKRLKKEGVDKLSLKINMKDGPEKQFIKHTGLVSAAAVAALSEAQFEADEEPEYDYAEFSADEAFAAFGTNEYRVPWIGGLFRRLRDWMIEKDGKETADNVLPSYEIDGLMDSPSYDKELRELEAAFGLPGEGSGTPMPPVKPSKSAEFSQSNNGSTMNEQEIQALKDKCANLEAENKQLKDADKDRQKADRAAAIDAVFAAEKYKGKVTDKNRDNLRKYAEGLVPEDAEFSAESDALKPLHDLLETMPVVHVEEEVATFEAAADGKTGGEQEDQRSKARKEINARLA